MDGFPLERTSLPVKDQSQILLNLKSYSMDRLKNIMSDSCSEKMTDTHQTLPLVLNNELNAMVMPLVMQFKMKN